MSINKDKLLVAVRFLLFALGAVLLTGWIGRVTIRKNSGGKLRAFYENQDTFDVLFTGISHMEVAYSPLELYQDFGITSFNFGESGNELPTSYWVVRNALDYAKPKLVVVDVRKIEADSIEYSNLTTTSFDAVPLSATKIRTAMDLFDTFTGRVEFLFPLLRYHSRWKELSENDFHQTDFRLDMGTLHYPDNRLKVAVPKNWVRISAEKQILTDSLSERYLRRLVKDCRRRGIEVLLVNLPYPADKDSQYYSNGVNTIAEELGVNYLDFLEEADYFNFNTDMNDSYGHINDSGSQKVTKYLGEYLLSHYDLPDRRQDRALGDWNQRLEEYKAYQFGRLGTQEGADTFLMLLSNDEFGKCLYLPPQSALIRDNRMQQLIQNAAGDFPLEALFDAALSGESYLLLVDEEGNGVFESLGGESFEADTKAFGHVIYSHDADGVPYLYFEGDDSNRLTGFLKKEEGDLAAFSSASWTGEVKESDFKAKVLKERTFSASKL